MRIGRGKIAAALAAVCTAALLIAVATPGSAKTVSRVSGVLDLRKATGFAAVLPDVSGFISKLREGEASRAFFDSPLGLHFLRSAPFRSTAHLHRFIPPPSSTTTRR
jgi:putative intracellular protease/amidase